MLGYLCDIQSTRRISDEMHDGRARTADIALIRRACDCAGLNVVDFDGDLFLLDNTGTMSWFNPLVVDRHAQMLFDAMHFCISGRLLTRRLVSPTGASVSAVCGPRNAWRKTVVEFAAAHSRSRAAVAHRSTASGFPGRNPASAAAS